jgi:hypothetical protein
MFEDEVEEAFWAELDRRFAEKHPKLVPFIEQATKEGDPRINDAILSYATIARDIGYDEGISDQIMDRDMAKAKGESE